MSEQPPPPPPPQQQQQPQSNGNEELSGPWEIVNEEKKQSESTNSAPTERSLAGRQPDPDGLREVLLSDDGEAVKVVLEEGKGEPPQVMSRAYVLLRGFLPDGTVFLDSTQEEFDFLIGRGEVALGLQMALSTMLPGERARVHCGVKFGYSDARRPAEVPPNSPISFEVTYLWSETEKNLHEMSMEDKVDFIKRRREIGKRQFQEGRVASALKQYEKALSVIGDGLEPEGEPNPALQQELRQLWLVHLTNAALCKSKVHLPQEARELCNKALAMDPNNSKALLHRADAHSAVAEYEEALRDLKRSLALLSAATEPDEALIEKVKRKIASVDKLRAEQTKKQMRAFSGMFKRELYEDKPMPRSSTSVLQSCGQRVRRGCSVVGRLIAAPFVRLFSVCKRKKGAGAKKKAS